MARGRMLNRSISYSKQVADLIARVGCDGGLFFTWMIAHLDRDGRIHGDPEVLKGIVCPRIAGVTPELIRRTAGVAAELGLIIWYRHEGDLYIAFPKFKENQPGLRGDRESKSTCPAPTCDTIRSVDGVTPEDCRSNSGVTPSEWNGIEVEVESKDQEKPSVELTLDDHDSVADKKQTKSKYTENTNTVFQHYRLYHPRACLDDRTKKAIKKRLENGKTVEELCMAIDGMHLTPHNLGENERGQKYLGLELCMRTGDQVTRFIEVAEQHANGTPPVLSEREAKGVRAAQAWLERKEKEDARRRQSKIPGVDPSTGGAVSG